MKIYRQGDIIFKQIERLPKGVKPKEDLVVAKGEATDHKHEFVDEKAVQLYVTDSCSYVVVETPTPIIHPEHEKIILDEGIYEIGYEREYDYFEESLRKVID